MGSHDVGWAELVVRVYDRSFHQNPASFMNCGLSLFRPRVAPMSPGTNPFSWMFSFRVLGLEFPPEYPGLGFELVRPLPFLAATVRYSWPRSVVGLLVIRSTCFPRPLSAMCISTIS